MTRFVDEIMVEVGRVVRRARRMLTDRGLVGTARFFATLIKEHLQLPLLRRRRARATFPFDGAELPYAYHLYGQTWRNERALEIAVAHHFLADGGAGRLLELGNVLGHFGYRGHDVVDRYEKVRGVHRCDIFDFQPLEPYDSIVSISTLEHVRFDEPQYDRHGAQLALQHLRKMLKPGGRLLVTVPLGYNEGLDEDIRNGYFSFDYQCAYKRVGKDNDWQVVDVQEGISSTYGEVYEAANAVLVGIDGPRRG